MAVPGVGEGQSPGAGIARFAELRRLALPTIFLVVLGWIAGWQGRRVLMTWLLNHTGETPVIAPSTAQALQRSLLELAFGFGIVLALPLIWWQVQSLVAPVTLARARPRFIGYLFVSFAVLLANPTLALVQTMPRGHVDLRDTRTLMVGTIVDLDRPNWYMCQRADEYVRLVGLGLLASAFAASLVTPIFILTRFHPQGVHERYVTISFSLAAGSLLLALLLFIYERSFSSSLQPSPPVLLDVAAMVAPALIRGLLRRRSGGSTWSAVVLSSVGSIVLLLAQLWLVARFGPLAACFIPVYWLSAALGMGLRRAASQVTAA